MMQDSGGGFVSQPSQEQQQQEKRRNSALVPLTIKMALNAQVSDDILLVDDREVSQVRICGNIMRVDQTETKYVYFIEDQTGLMEVTHWNNAGDEDLNTLRDRREKMAQRTYVAVVGQLKSYEARVTLSAYDIRPIEDMNELTHHFLETIYVSAKTTSSSPSSSSSYAPNAQTGVPMDGAREGDNNNNNNNGSLTSIQLQVLEHYSLHGTGDEGLHIESVIYALNTISPADVKAAVDALTNEGHLYSTVDDDHHKSTDSE
ncbi:hypothetical protein CTAYLR_006182 [Chrysophaeum taylorii]|uniref:Replication protein A C-terminal domain-containing protein n=1 Tax=Chrysophaeum taylorii TaxID=2483200 RepID=A0AAD7UP40_9STRA|nr:hypothetical protein CTAYLR_006182 [Chrysophaeum taylorii]